MHSDAVLDTLLLFALGLCGWGLFSLLRLPAASFLGSITVIGILRALQVDLPYAPPSLSLLTQLFLGIYVGSKVTRETSRQLKEMAVPVMIIVVWSIGIALGLGQFLALTTGMDLYTAILSSSVGGLPEMTIIALALNIEVTAVIIMQCVRMILTVVTFPVILNLWVKYRKKVLRPGAADTENPESEVAAAARESAAGRPKKWQLSCLQLAAGIKEITRNRLIIPKKPEDRTAVIKLLSSGMITLAVAAGGAFLCMRFKIPAGVMVGAMSAVMLASLSGVSIKAPPPGLFSFLIVGVGMVTANNISPRTMEIVASGELLAPIIISTVVVFATSLLVTLAISKLVHWDLPTSFLAAAPGGFSIMVALAIANNKDPFRVSILHLGRLIALKTIIPLLFMTVYR